MVRPLGWRWRSARSASRRRCWVKGPRGRPRARLWGVDSGRWLARVGRTSSAASSVVPRPPGRPPRGARGRALLSPPAAFLGAPPAPFGAPFGEFVAWGMGARQLLRHKSGWAKALEERVGREGPLPRRLPPRLRLGWRRNSLS